MRIVLWAVFLAILVIMWGREFITLGEARRDGTAKLSDLHRFRRRSLGLFLLLALGIGMDMSLWVRWEMPWQEVGFYGIFFILFAWLLLVAGRDLKATLLSFAHEEQEVTVKSLKEMQRAMGRNRLGHGRDRDPIPLMDFRGKPRDGSSARIPRMALADVERGEEDGDDAGVSGASSREEESGEPRR